ncbi:MAG TPA: WGR domain-containing protein [Gammaproteobacteria bacterium]
MRIYLQSQPTDTGVIRFVHLILQEDLIGGWNLIRESGAQGSAGSIKREHFEDQAAALEAMLTWRDKNITRGYRVAFVHGDKQPNQD